MFLNHEEIKEKQLLSNTREDAYKNASYDLTISMFVDMDGKTIEGKDASFVLRPQSMVYVIFAEEVKVPADLIGFAHVKTSLTSRGILATNIGIIDSGYEGKISTLLINFGKQDCNLSIGESALRLTFAELRIPEEPKKRDKSKDYLRSVKKKTESLDEKFLNLGSVEEQVKKSIKSSILTYGIIVTLTGLLLNVFSSIWVNMRNYSDAKGYVEQVSESINRIEVLQEKYDSLAKEVSARDSIAKKVVPQDSISKHPSQ